MSPSKILLQALTSPPTGRGRVLSQKQISHFPKAAFFLKIYFFPAERGRENYERAEKMTKIKPVRGLINPTI